MSKNDFLTFASQGNRFTVREIMDEFQVSDPTARRWVNSPDIAQVPGSWPPAYTHRNHVFGNGNVPETPVGKIDTPEKLSRLEKSLIAAVPWSKQFSKDLQGENFPDTLEMIYDKVIREPRDYSIEDMFSNASSETDVWDIVNKCWTLLVLCKYQLDIYSKEKE